jgi:hypothetical protein
LHAIRPDRLGPQPAKIRVFIEFLIGRVERLQLERTWTKWARQVCTALVRPCLPVSVARIKFVHDPALGQANTRLSPLAR